jgi:hypothetical protein
MKKQLIKEILIIKEILTDEVLIFAYRKRLWKNGVTPTHKLSDSVICFLQFLESHNALFDFIDTFKSNNRDGYITIADYFKNRDEKFYLRGAFYWQFAGHYEIWNGLNELWNNQIKNQCK